MKKRSGGESRLREKPADQQLSTDVSVSLCLLAMSVKVQQDAVLSTSCAKKETIQHFRSTIIVNRLRTGRTPWERETPEKSHRSDKSVDQSAERV